MISLEARFLNLKSVAVAIVVVWRVIWATGAAVPLSKAKLLWNTVEGSAKRWILGCVNSLPAARGSQEA